MATTVRKLILSIEFLDQQHMPLKTHVWVSLSQVDSNIIQLHIWTVLPRSKRCSGKAHRCNIDLPNIHDNAVKIMFDFYPELALIASNSFFWEQIME